MSGGAGIIRAGTGSGSSGGARSAFGEQLVAELTPKVQLQFPYNINTAQVVAFPGNGGSVTNGNGHANCSTGTAADGFAFIISHDVLKYNSGQGALFRGDCIFTTGVADSTQIIGVGNNLNGYFFGYNGADFGVLRRRGGQPETRTLTVTTGSSTAENITITLDGDAIATVAVTASSDVTVTAREISEAFYASVGTGWGAILRGDKVEFISFDTADHDGVYSITATTAAGTYAQTIDANAATDSWIPQASWNVDKFNGRGASGMTLDTTKGNEYKISYQWGYGDIEFSIENPHTGDFALAHRIEYSNANTDSSIAQPSLRLFMEAVNSGGTTDLTMKSSSMAGFIEGREMNLGPRHGADNILDIGTGIIEEPILTIRNKQIYQSHINEVRIVLESLTLSSDLGINGSTTFRIYQDASPENGTSYSDINSSGSVVEYDTDAADFDIGNADLLETFILGRTDSEAFRLGDTRDQLAPGCTIMVTAQPSKSHADNAVGASINWRELF
tara:strand:- start:19572 stop:21083 length:1512 start_codon:yes stop_codon:yes gene_type:complete